MTEPNETIELINCEDSEVLLFENYYACVVGRFKHDIKNWLEEYSKNLVARLGDLHGTTVFNAKPNQFEWFKQGKDCEILRLGAKDWEPGKVRIKFTLEFCPDEPEEEEEIEADEMKQLEDSLDDLRQKLNPDN